MKKSTKKGVIYACTCILSLILLTTIIVLSINKSLEGKLSDEISIIGEIKSVSNEENKIGNIYVEGAILSNTIYDKANITITKNTKITDKESGKKLQIIDLEIGTAVEVWFTGAVKESYPIQADALWIKVKK